MKMGDEIVLFMENLISPSVAPQCRICHEEEVQSSKRLEAPCACSGTVKFAHRECIQRWCNEKGNTTCEICLQKFEAGYTAPPKKAQLADITVTIRRSLEVPRQEQELHNPDLIVAVDEGILETNYSECSFVVERSTSCCRPVVVMFAMILLVKHLFSLLTGETEQYAFTIFSIFVLRAIGIILPLYVLMRMITAIQDCLQQEQHEFDDTSSLLGDDDDDDDDDDEDGQLHHTIQIHF